MTRRSSTSAFGSPATRTRSTRSTTRSQSLIEQEADGNIPFVKKDTDDGIVIASNDAYADKLGSDGKLGDSDAFTSVVDDGASKEFVLFFNFDQVEEQVLQAAPDDGAPAEVIDNLRPLQAVAITSETDGNYTKGTLRRLRQRLTPPAPAPPEPDRLAR